MSVETMTRCDWPLCSDSLPAVCGESLWLNHETSGLLEWKGVELLCVGVNPIVGTVFFLSERNPTWYECANAKDLTHVAPTIVQALEDEARVYAYDPSLVGVDTGDPESLNRWLCSVIERAAAAREQR